MDGSEFDEVTRAISRSRRSVMAMSLVIATGWLGAAAADAKKKHRHKKHKKRKPKATPNAYGCLEVGDPCSSEEQCCSGICEGKSCRAHGTETCDQTMPGACTNPNPELSACGGSQSCFCVQTTAGSNFCGELYYANKCADCQKDADCEALGYPPGSACAPFAAGNCAAFGCGETGMACLPPCGYVPPDAP